MHRIIVHWFLNLRRISCQKHFRILVSQPWKRQGKVRHSRAVRALKIQSILIMNHGNCAYRPVRCQDNSISVNNLSSCRFDFSFSLMKIFRQLLIMCSIKNHQINKSSEKSRNQKNCAEKNKHCFFSVICFIFHKKQLRERHFYNVLCLFRSYSCLPVCYNT